MQAPQFHQVQRGLGFAFQVAGVHRVVKRLVPSNLFHRRSALRTPRLRGHKRAANVKFQSSVPEPAPNHARQGVKSLEAWEAMNMTQIDALDKLKSILVAQVEIEKQLETK